MSAPFQRSVSFFVKHSCHQPHPPPPPRPQMAHQNLVSKRVNSSHCVKYCFFEGGFLKANEHNSGIERHNLREFLKSYLFMANQVCVVLMTNQLRSLLATLVPTDCNLMLPQPMTAVIVVPLITVMWIRV